MIVAFFIYALTIAKDAGQAAPAPQQVALRSADDRADVAEMLRAINAARAERGLRPLALDDRLCGIAESHARDMALRRYFAHTSPEGVSVFDRMKDAQYRFNYAGENLALDRNADAAEDALWNSADHRSNILEPHYAHVGIAAVPSDEGEIFVQDFSD